MKLLHVLVARSFRLVNAMPREEFGSKGSLDQPWPADGIACGAAPTRQLRGGKGALGRKEQDPPFHIF